MTWVRLDDQYHNHPKVLGLSDAAYRLHTGAICYCAEFLTDGLLPAGWIREKRPDLVAECVSARVWDRHEDGSYWVHDYLDYNPSGAQVRSAREQERDRKAAWRAGTTRDQSGQYASVPPSVPPGQPTGLPPSVLPLPSPSPSPSPCLSLPSEDLSETSGSGPASDVDSGVPEEEIQLVYRHYLDAMGFSERQYRLTPKRRKKLRTRLTEFTPSKLITAIDRCRASPFHMGQNGTHYNDLCDNILRSEEHVEKWLNGQLKKKK